MDAITVKIPALLLMVQALSNGGMDYVTLFTEALPDGLSGYLHFQAYRQGDPALGLMLPAAQALPHAPVVDGPTSPQVITGTIQ